MILGWVGAAAGVVAYAQVTRGRWSASSAPFQLTNLTAAGLMGLVAAANGVWPSVFANLVWIVIGVQAVVLIVRARRARRRTVEPVAAPEPLLIAGNLTGAVVVGSVVGSVAVTDDEPAPQEVGLAA
ncbi:CBU_0592 family membrane protein [Cellulosimicrobium marinum]|uniref:CBU_0592 family membrane protein n=1 Tax=Cellulosimicrobium marinum TaxID=1638992 RepID=UPI001E32662D|nr:hypothetical protein [Cellulosimicrobium marinum]